MRPGLGLLVLAALALVPGGVRAGEISLQTTLKVDVGDSVRVSVTVRNHGNDTAHDVTPRLRFSDAVRTGEVASEMAPNANREWTLEFPRPEQPGRYPLLSTVTYTDPGFRGFSAVSAMLVDVGGVFPARLRGNTSKTALDGEGQLTVTVESDDEPERAVSVSALLPDELGGLRDLGRVRIRRGAPRTLTVPIQNFGALPGSRYPVYAVARTTDGDRDTAALLVGSIEVTSSLAVIDWQAYLPQTAAVLAGLFILAEITVRLAERSRLETPPRRT